MDLLEYEILNLGLSDGRVISIAIQFKLTIRLKFHHKIGKVNIPVDS